MGIFTTAGLMRSIGSTSYSALNIALRIVGYLLWAIPFAILRMTLAQFSYLQLLILSVSVAGLAGKTIANKTSALLRSQRNGTEN